VAEYVKDNKKSAKPTSIRFNEGQLKVAMARSGKKGRQQFIDWLIDWYVNGEPQKKPDYSNNVKQSDNWTKAEPFQEPKPVVQVPQLSQKDAYVQEITDARSYAELVSILEFVTKDEKLLPKDVRELNSLAAQVQKTKGLYTD